MRSDWLHVEMWLQQDMITIEYDYNRMQEQLFQKLTSQITTWVTGTEKCQI